jgi:hypothetical protein
VNCLKDAAGQWWPRLLTYAEIREELATTTGPRRDAVREEAPRRTRITGYRWPAELLAF